MGSLPESTTMQILKFTLGQSGFVEMDKAAEVFEMVKAEQWTAENLWSNWDSQQNKGEAKFSLTGISCFLTIGFDSYADYQSFVGSVPTGYNFSDEQTTAFCRKLLTFTKEASCKS